ncbi:MAG TPA: TetR/AcrR family transcriptional regulator [Patescibacteria group bacterium]|nr:TetR/AcrR family transcriptional regulator [Patescibacteria group bacterium]
MEYSLSRREREKMQRKSEIIEVAEKLFIKYGYEGTSMDDISKEAQFTKPTLYQYFLNKEDLFFAVVLKFAKQYISNTKESIEGKRNALEKIYHSNLQFFKFFKENPEIFQMFDYTPPSKSAKEASPNYLELLKLQDESFKMYTEIIEEGKKDGSMSPDLDAKKAAHAGVLTTISFMNTISKSNDSYFETYGFDKDDFILYGLKMIAEALAQKNG